MYKGIKHLFHILTTLLHIQTNERNYPFMNDALIRTFLFNTLIRFAW